ncbi:unnamed protein product [Amoebophrya sp. A25]|nr:unnamed protein product [Amoebophrya sp. A25]|eukprot:GSA25T00019044001.1
MDERYQNRRKNYKKGISSEDFRRQREDDAVQVRKAAKEATLNAKRLQLQQGGSQPSSGVATSSNGHQPLSGGGTGIADTNHVPLQPDTLHQSQMQMQGLQEMQIGTTTASSSSTGGNTNMAGALAAAQYELELPQLIQTIAHGTVVDKLPAVKKIRQLLSMEQSPPIQKVIDCGLVPQLVQFLHEPSRNAVDPSVTDSDTLEALAKIRFEAAWSLTNIASGTETQTQTVIDHGGIPAFVRLLSSKDSDVREQAMWGLGNISGDSPSTRDLVLNAGALAPIMEQVKHSQSAELLRNATWTLSNLCRGKPAPAFEAVQPCLAVLQTLIYHQDLEVVIDACWALSYFSDGDRAAERIDAIINAGVCRRACELLSHADYLVVIPALRLVGNICVGNDYQTDLILECDALPKLLGLLSHARKHIRKETCWTISNITAGNSNQIQKAVDSGVLPALVTLYKERPDFDVKKEIVWVFRNALASGLPSQLKYMLERGCLEMLVDMLDISQGGSLTASGAAIQQADKRILMAAIEGIHYVLERGVALTNNDPSPFCVRLQETEGVERLRILRDEFAPESVSVAANHILQMYFPEVDDACVADEQPESQNNFAHQGPHETTVHQKGITSSGGRVVPNTAGAFGSMHQQEAFGSSVKTGAFSFGTSN